MEIAINAVLTIVGLVLLCFGGNWLVTGGVSIAKKFGISSLIIGMTVVAYGTSTPELAASIAAAGTHTDLILGNVVGSNISNIGMVIGISAILVPIAAAKSTIRKEVPIMIGVSVLIIALSIDGEISQYDGILLIGGLVAFTVYTFRSKNHFIFIVILLPKYNNLIWQKRHNSSKTVQRRPSELISAVHANLWA